MPVSHDQPRWKTNKLNWTTIAAMDNTVLTASLRVLTARQQGILLSFIEQVAWQTRWDNLAITKDDLAELAANLGNSIMAEYAIDCDDVENCLTTSVIILAIQAAIAALQDSVDDLQDNPPDGTDYPPLPATQTSQSCNGAYYVTAQFRAWIAAIELSVTVEPTIFDVVEEMLALNPRATYETLLAFIQSLFATPSSILPEYDAATASMIDYLACTGNSKSAFRAWLTAQGLDEIGTYLDCLTNTAWLNWFSVGTSIETETCACVGIEPSLVVPCYGGGIAGANITNISGNRWSIDSTARPGVPDVAITIADVYGRAFTLSNIVYTTSPVKNAGKRVSDLVCYINVGPGGGGLALYEAGWTWASGSHTVTFDMN